MANGSVKSVNYSPGLVPTNLQQHAEFLRNELQRLKDAIDMLADGHLDQVNVAPAKVRDGDIRLADGTDWNPGSGQGVYCYYNSTWNKLG